MTLRNIIYQSGLLLFCIFSFLMVFQRSVFAQSASITIIPPKFELYANPGETLTERIRVRNNANFPATYTIKVEDFTTSGEEGHVVVDDDGQPNHTFSLAKWIEASSKDIVLQPNEEKAMTFTINVPRNAEPGGHYASILFQSGAETKIQGSGASVAQRVGSLVLLRVSGNVEEKAVLESFSAPSYSEHGPINFLMRVKNDSNTHIRPEGTIIITDLFGKKVDEVPLDGRNVLPGAVRKMTTVWEAKNALGIYTATLISTYGQKKLPMTAAVKFTVIPKIVLVLWFVAAIAIIGFLLTLIMGRERFAKVLKVMFKG